MARLSRRPPDGVKAHRMSARDIQTARRLRSIGACGACAAPALVRPERSLNYRVRSPMTHGASGALDGESSACVVHRTDRATGVRSRRAAVDTRHDGHERGRGRVRGPRPAGTHGHRQGPVPSAQHLRCRDRAFGGTGIRVSQRTLCDDAGVPRQLATHPAIARRCGGDRLQSRPRRRTDARDDRHSLADRRAARRFVRAPGDDPVRRRARPDGHGPSPPHGRVPAARHP